LLCMLLLLLLLTYTTVVVATTSAAEKVPTPPNIVLIVADDLGWGEVSTTPDVVTVHRRIETPQLVQIFGEGGLIFDAAYAGYSVCGPSRSTLMSGRHAGRLYAKDLPKSLNMPQLMRSAGYATGCFGKSDPLTNPTGVHGFDYFFGQNSQAKCHDMYPPEVDAALGQAQWTVPLAGNNWTTSNVSATPAARRRACMARPSSFTYTSDVFEEAAASWIRNQSQPYFAYVAYTTPHAGDWGTNKETGNPVPSDLQYASTGYPDVEKDHAASISYMDASIRRLVAGLDLRSTFVFFVSDNGAHEEGGHNHSFYNSTAGLRGFKRSLYEGGVRSPSMVIGPGVPAGTRSRLPWAFWDLLPTFAELAKAPTTQLPGIDGVSIAQELMSPNSMLNNWTWTGFWTWGNGPTHTKGFTVRRGNFKGVVTNCSHFYDQKSAYYQRPSPDDVWALYDLAQVRIHAVVTVVDASTLLTTAVAGSFRDQGCGS
jgi:arylsulfatase A